MLHEYSRMELLVGEQNVEALGKARVAVFGIGGVGSYTAEALARCGVGTITLVDNDVVSLTDLNRQLIALHSTLGRPKTQVMKERIRDIDPDILVNTYETFSGRIRRNYLIFPHMTMWWTQWTPYPPSCF